MKVKFHNPEYPSGMEVDFGGLLVINGRTVEFDKEELDAYKGRHGVTLKERLLNSPFATVDGKQGEVTYLHPVEDSTSEVVSEESEPEKGGEK